MSARFRFALLSAVILLVLLRLCLLLFSRTIYGDYDEELIVGNFAADLLSGGLALPLAQYMQTPDHGASMLMSFTTLPIFALAGDSYFALKLAPLLWSVTTLLLLYLAVAAYANPRAALLACGLFVLSPASYTGYMEWAHARHQYLFMVMLAFLWILHRIGTERAPSAACGWIAALGAAMGFSLFLMVSNSLAALLAAVFLFWQRRSDGIGLLLRYGACLALGICIGLLPALFHLDDIAQYMSFINRAEPRSWAYLSRRLAVVLGYGLLRSYRPWGGIAPFVSWIGYATAIASWIWIYWAAFRTPAGGERTLLRFIGAYLPAYAFLLARSNLEDGLRPDLSTYTLRWLSPMLSLFMISTALMACRWLASKARAVRILAGAVLAGYAAAGGIAFASILIPLAPGYGLRQPGCFVQEIGCRISELYLDDERFAAAMSKIDAKRDPLLRTDIARGAAWTACLNRIMRDRLTAVDPSRFPLYEAITAQRVPLGLQSVFREELGAFVFSHNGYDLSATLDTLSRGLTGEQASDAMVGLARMLPAWTTDPGKLNGAIREIPLPDKNRLAFAMGQYFAADPPRDALAEAIAGHLAAPAAGRGNGCPSLAESFHAGCRAPYGSRMYWPPSHCH